MTTDPVVAIKAVSGAAQAAAGFTVTYSSPSTSTEDTGETTTVSEPAPTTAAISTAALRFGVGTPGGPMAGAELDEVAALAGEAPSIILSYKDFTRRPR